MKLLKTAVAAASLAALAGLVLADPPGTGKAAPGCGPGAMGYGPGAMMGYGPGGYGPDGMMAYGNGPGMRGRGGPGMIGGGPGMMGYGYGMQGALGLSDEQRKKIDAIHDDMQTRNWDLMGKMRIEMSKMRELLATEPLDRTALDAVYKQMNDLRQQRFDAHLAAHEQTLAVLTKEQLQQLKGLGPWWLDAE